MEKMNATEINTKVQQYLKVVKQHMEKGSFADAAVNARHALEAMLDAYAECYLPEAGLLRTLDKIDALDKAHIISRSSCDAMHGIRKIANRGAHNAERPLTLKEVSFALAALKKELKVLNKYFADNAFVTNGTIYDPNKAKQAEIIEEQIEIKHEKDERREKDEEKQVVENAVNIAKEHKTMLLQEPNKTFLLGRGNGTVCLSDETENTKLLIVERQRGTRIVNLKGTMTMGRNAGDQTKDIALDSSIASREHGVFVFDELDKSYYYKDSNSLNGTYINGKKLQPAPNGGEGMVKLSDGDIIRIDRDIEDPHEDAVVIIFTTTVPSDVKPKKYKLILGKKQTLTVGRSAIIPNAIAVNECIPEGVYVELETRRKDVILVAKSKTIISVNHMIPKGKEKLRTMDVIRVVNNYLFFLGDEIIFV